MSHCIYLGTDDPPTLDTVADETVFLGKALADLPTWQLHGGTRLSLSAHQWHKGGVFGVRLLTATGGGCGLRRATA